MRDGPLKITTWEPRNHLKVANPRDPMMQPKTEECHHLGIDPVPLDRHPGAPLLQHSNEGEEIRTHPLLISTPHP